jgi:hypothetical protein
MASSVRRDPKESLCDRFSEPVFSNRPSDLEYFLGIFGMEVLFF